MRNLSPNKPWSGPDIYMIDETGKLYDHDADGKPD